MSHRVRRDLPGNSYVQLKASTLPECRAFLKSVQGKWTDLADTGTFGGGEPYVATIKGNALIVTQGDLVIDKYIIEAA